MMERHDGSAWEEEMAAADEKESLGQGVSVDELQPHEDLEAGAGGEEVEMIPAAQESGADAGDEGTADETQAPSPKMAEYDETFVTLEPGQIVHGKVVQIGSDEVMVDVGYKSEGRIPLHELGLDRKSVV